VGMDMLGALDALVDIKNNLLKTKDTTIKLFGANQDKKKPITHIYQIKIQPRTQQKVCLPTDNEDGEGIVDYVKFSNGIEMPNAIVKIKNKKIITTIVNSTNREATIKLTEKIKVHPLQENIEINHYDSYSPPQQQINRIQRENLKNLRLDHLNRCEKEKIQSLCNEYCDIFYDERLQLTFTNAVKHKIRLNDDNPVYVRAYRTPPIQKEEIKSQVEKLLKQDIIQPSSSPWNFPVHLVPKKADASGQTKWRMVIDYRKLNDKTIQDKYPLPNINDILDKLGKSQYFTTMDLASGYHQIEMDPKDIEKTAFSTENGHWEFKRMPFGVCSAPATFQRVMDNILRGLQGEKCLVYLDDIIVYSASLEEHIQKLREVFRRLKQANFKIQLNKSEFLRKEVSYLGHIITNKGVKPNPDKIKAVVNYPLPKTTKEIKAYLGLLGYYRRFIKDFAKIMKPLTKCLKKKAKININDPEYIKAFELGKTIITNHPILQYPDFNKPFILTTDASNVALGAVLSQGEIGSDKPIAYASRTLSDTEQKYSTIEKELLAIVWGVKYFRPYLYGTKFIIYTDHRPLTWLFSLKDANSKLTRWRLKLQECNYEIRYRKGSQNTNADALSRIQINSNDTESLYVHPDSETDELDDDIPELLERLNQEPLFDFSEINLRSNEVTPQRSHNNNTPARSLPQSPDVDTRIASPPQEEIFLRSPHEINTPDVSPMHNPNNAQSTPLEEDIQTAHSSPDNDVTGIPILDEAIDSKNPQFFIKQHNRSETEVSQQHNNTQKIYHVSIPGTNNYRNILEFIKHYTAPGKKFYFFFENDELYRQFNRICLEHFNARGPKIIRCTRRCTYVESRDEQNEIIKRYHEGKTNHRGITETRKHLQRTYYWINMNESITRFINNCEICKRAKYERLPAAVPMMLTDTCFKPFERIHIDVFTIQSQRFLTVVDAFSKIGQAIPIISKTAICVVEALLQYFSYYGTVENITADGGSEFDNETVKSLLELHKIHLHITTPRNPSSNGIVERFHSTIIEQIRLLKEQSSESIVTIMKYAIIAYNNTIHIATDLTPVELLFGHTKSRDPYDIYYDKTF
jgi:hypothetical protein